MLNETDEKSTLVLVLSIVIVLLVCGAFLLDNFNRHSFHKSSYELITDPQTEAQINSSH